MPALQGREVSTACAIAIDGSSAAGKPAVGTRDYITGPYELMELDCGHWIVQEAFDDVVGRSSRSLEKYSEVSEEFANASS